MRADELLERVELLGLADDLEDERLRPDVGDPRVEDVGQRHQLGAPLGRRRDRDQRQLALDRVARLELAHAQDVDELVHLLLDLLERLLVAVDAERDAARRPARSVGPTARLSMLNPRRANSWQTRTSAPGLSSTSTDSVWIIATAHRLGLGLLVLEHVERGRAGRDHREALLERVDPRVDDGGPAAGERLGERRLELVLVRRR